MHPAAILIACATVAGAILAPLPAVAVPVLPDFGAASFTPGQPVDNPYFPLLSTGTRTYVAVDPQTGEPADERFELTNIGLGPIILGVQTSIQRDRAFEEGRLVEDTFDYFAQDDAGNVWYFGEDVTNYIYGDEGNLIGTNNESAWRAGVNGALPGFIMPADLDIGFNYFQEFAPNDDALDQGTIFALGLTIDGFTDVLQIFETSEIEPNLREFKYYAPGTGLIRADEDLDESLQNPELIFRLQPASVPAPAASFLLLGLGAILARRRLQRG